VSLCTKTSILYNLVSAVDFVAERNKHACAGNRSLVIDPVYVVLKHAKIETAVALKINTHTFL
jgi:hypothetical protein